MKKYCGFWIILFVSLLMINGSIKASAEGELSEEEVTDIVTHIFENRNKAIINEDVEFIQSIYDTDTKYGTWAFQYEQKKMKYINNWGEKQGVKFTSITPTLLFRSIKNNNGGYSVNLLCSTEYRYVYEDTPSVENVSRIGTYHTLQLKNKDGIWVISKEWYKDPFGDSLNLEKLKTDSIKPFILSQLPRDLSSIGERRINAVDYAMRFCGAASYGENGFKYNKKYRDYNPQGGDCANFASQILYEGGKFKRNSNWNYDKNGATGSWVNAGTFMKYMTGSGRASLIAHGSYEKIYKASFKLLPGDFIAYEKKGDINHISTVTACDSKGYALVTCHNSDRYNVPWDLGWSNTNIKFWLVHVNY